MEILQNHLSLPPANIFNTSLYEVGLSMVVLCFVSVLCPAGSSSLPCPRKGHRQPKEGEPCQMPTLLALRPWTSSLQTWEIISCYLSFLVCGILSGWPELTNTWAQFDFLLLLYLTRPAIKVSPGSVFLSNTWLANAAVLKVGKSWERTVSRSSDSPPCESSGAGPARHCFQSQKPEASRPSLFPTYHMPAAFNLCFVTSLLS